MILVDTNILLDITTADPAWSQWSLAQLDLLREHDALAVNPTIYGELCVRAPTRADVDDLLSQLTIDLVDPSRDALFLAAKAFARYRARGGPRVSVLPDFFIGGQAAADGLTVLTRDPRRIAEYFPDVDIIAP